MKVQLTRSTMVRHERGTILDVSEKEGRRLIAFGLASPVAEEPKKTARKKAKKEA